MNGFMILAHVIALELNYSRAKTVGVGFLLNEIFALIVKFELGISNMLDAPNVLINIDIAITLFVVVLFRRVFDICKKNKKAGAACFA